MKSRRGFSKNFNGYVAYIVMLCGVTAWLWFWFADDRGEPRGRDAMLAARVVGGASADE